MNRDTINSRALKDMKKILNNIELSSSDDEEEINQAFHSMKISSSNSIEENKSINSTNISKLTSEDRDEIWIEQGVAQGAYHFDVGDEIVTPPTHNTTTVFPICDCVNPTPAKSLVVKKDNENRGRTFYTCNASKCTFFKWENVFLLEQSVKCQCGIPSKFRVVRKNNINRGRTFLNCPKVKDRCTFFQWLT